MELNFTKDGKNFVAEFEATGVFNLHLERGGKGGDIKMLQRTSPRGEFAFVNDFSINSKFQVAIDEDMIGCVFPKTIRIESEVEPTYAEVTFRG